MPKRSDFDLEQAAWMKRVDQYIKEAEEHLALPHGTLADIRHDTDYLKILKMHATVEPLLNELLEESVTRAMRHPKVSFPGGEAIGKFIVGGPLRSKIKLARESELLTDTHVEFIAALADVRNFYAHSVKNMTMRIDEAAEKLSPSDKGFRLQKRLFGLSTDSKDNGVSRVALAMIQPFMFFHFAGLLSALISGIKPPPSLGPLLSGLQAGQP